MRVWKLVKRLVRREFAVHEAATRCKEIRRNRRARTRAPFLP